MNTAYTYKQAGVNIDEADKFVHFVKKIARSTRRPEVKCDIGGFGGLFALDLKKYSTPVFVSSTDGVGTKLKIAQLAKRYDALGVDLVAMNVNDILCCGAEPLFFMDYLAVGKVDHGVMNNIVKGIIRGCKEAGCSLIGGETAEMPGVYRPDEFDLAGFCVGVVDADNIINGQKITHGNKIIGLESNGLHSNGFSLVRRIFSESELEGLAMQLLKPTHIYVKEVKEIIAAFNVKGIAHITGGAFYDKISRILPSNCAAKIEKRKWVRLPLFQAIQDRANIDDYEMYRTFNMGIGMVLIVDAKDVKDIIKIISKYKYRAWEIGEIVKGRAKVEVI